MAYGDSNGHVIDVTMKGQIPVTPMRLVPLLFSNNR